MGSRSDIFHLACISRLLIILIQVLCNALVPDHNADAFRTPNNIDALSSDPELSLNHTIFDNLLHVALSGLSRWDAQYFLHIAQHGYTYETCLAFLPLYPMLLYAASYVFHLLFCCYLTPYSSLLVTAVNLNVVLFGYAAVVLYDLTADVTSDRYFAYKATVLFCLNPASVFFTAAYSESLYAFLAFFGMFLWERKRLNSAILVFALTACTRSNGILHLGFPLYSLVQLVGLKLLTLHLQKLPTLTFLKLSLPIAQLGAVKLIPVVLRCVAIAAPFAAYQYYTYALFCLPDHYGESFLSPEVLRHAKRNSYRLAVAYSNSPSHIVSPWCHHSVPLSYNYVQQHHWDVGLFRYYQWKQVPNFLLAFPMILLCARGIWKYSRVTWKEYNHRREIVKDKKSPAHGAGNAHTASKYKRPPKHKVVKAASAVKERFVWNGRLLPYVCHCAALLTVGVMCIHVQVITRLLACSCPAIYWFAASILPSEPLARFIKPEPPKPPTNNHKSSPIKPTEKRKLTAQDLMTVPEGPPFSPDLTFTAMLGDLRHWTNTATLSTKILLMYFVGYCVIGTAMFSNYLPWT